MQALATSLSQRPVDSSHRRALAPIATPDRLLLGPGPSNAHPTVLQALSRTPIGHLDPLYVELMSEVQELLRYAWQTDNRLTLPMSGTGSAAMEATLANTVEPGDTVLVAVKGYFGLRLADMAGRYRADVKTIEKLRNFADSNQIPMLEAARHVDKIESLAKRSAGMVKKFVTLFDHLQVKSTASLEDLLRYLVEEIDFDAYMEKTASDDQADSPMANVDELISAAVEFDRQHPEDGSLEAFLEQVALVSDTDAFEDASDRVTIMTLHAAKGLEFKRVFIIGVEDELLPHKRSKNSEWEIEEERRLLFVGITRAEERLELSCCKHPPASTLLQVSMSFFSPFDQMIIGSL